MAVTPLSATRPQGQAGGEGKMCVVGMHYDACRKEDVDGRRRDGTITIIKYQFYACLIVIGHKLYTAYTGAGKGKLYLSLSFHHLALHPMYYEMT